VCPLKQKCASANQGVAKKDFALLNAFNADTV
jgi:hypothetical protein